MKIPNTPFSTRLSGSAKETELRLRNIFQWKKKRPPVVLILLVALVVLLCFGLVSCETEAPEQNDPPVSDVTEPKESELPGKIESDKPEETQDPAKPENTDIPMVQVEPFTNLQNHEFYFSSGAGGWATVLQINADGSFSGEYHDSDMGVSGVGYPGGTQYYCAFQGRFAVPVQVNEYTYSTRIESMNYANEVGTEQINGGVRYIYSDAYGLMNGEEILIYLPNAPLSELPEEFKNWVGRRGNQGELTFYGLYNVTEQTGFSGYEKIIPPVTADTFPRQIPLEQETLVDLNGDGKEETLVVKLVGSEFGNRYELLINGQDGTEQLNLFYDNPDPEEFTLVDLDTRDGMLEIALSYEGPSNDPCTIFLRYENGALTQLGEVYGMATEGDLQYSGVGSIFGDMRLSVLQTWFAPAWWKIGDDGLLTLGEQELYYPYNSKQTQFKTALRELAAYTEMDENSERISLPVGTQMTFLATDNRCWVQCADENSTVFWLHLDKESGQMVELIDGSYVLGAMDGLTMAD